MISPEAEEREKTPKVLRGEWMGGREGCGLRVLRPVVSDPEG